MSRFFQNLEEEQKEIKKMSSSVSADEESTSFTKTDRRLDELRKKVAETLKATKHFEKLAKKLLAELKKQDKLLDEDRLPAFVMEFLEDPRIRRSATLLAAARDLLTAYPASREEYAGGIDEEAEASREVLMRSTARPAGDASEEEYGEILKISDDAQRVQSLSAFIEKTADEEWKCVATIALFTAYAKLGDAQGVLDTLATFRVLATHANRHANTMKGRLNTFIGRAYQLIQKEDYDKYQSVLASLLPLDPEVVGNRQLEFKVFKLSITPETDNPVFVLIRLVRAGDWARAHSHFEEHRELLTGGEAADRSECSYDSAKPAILAEFADLALANKAYQLAFDIFSHCSDRGIPGLGFKLSVLCVILNEAVRETGVFKEFLKNFQGIDRNPLMLRSASRDMEVMRSFFLLNVFDFEGAGKIIHSLVGVECSEHLRECVLGMVKREHGLSL